MFQRKKSKVNTSLKINSSSIVPSIKVYPAIQGKAETDPTANDLKRLMNYNGMVISSIEIKEEHITIHLERNDKKYTIISPKVSLVDENGKVIDTSIPNWFIKGNFLSTGNTIQIDGNIFGVP